jgi:hypothetical protein
MGDIANVLIGIGELYSAPEGESLPDTTGDSITWAGNWKKVGFTDDGVSFEHGVEHFDAVIDQALSPVKKVPTAEAVTIRTNLAEADLERLALAISGAAFSTIAQGSGQSGQDVVKIGGGPLVVKALGFEGTSPAGGFRVIFVHRVVATEAMTQSYKKGEKTMFPVAFAALADLSKAVGEELVTVKDWKTAAL